MQQRKAAYAVVADLSTREMADLLLEYPATVDDPLLRGLHDEFGRVIDGTRTIAS